MELGLPVNMAGGETANTEEGLCARACVQRGRDRTGREQGRDYKQTPVLVNNGQSAPSPPPSQSFSVNQQI